MKPETITITLPGTPVAKGRPRFTRNGHAYTDAKTTAAERAIVDAWTAQAGDRSPHDGPVRIEVLALFPIPASWPRWKREQAIDDCWPHQGRPDVDNIAKTILDGLNGYAWIDDAQVNAGWFFKGYAETPITQVTITFLPKPERN